MRKFKYKIGDPVVVCDAETLRQRRNCDDNPGYCGDMPDYSGTVTTIRVVNADKDREIYKLQDLPYWWSVNWIEPVPEIPDELVKVFDELL